MLSFRNRPKSRYTNIEKSRAQQERRNTWTEKNEALVEEPDKSDRSHIDQLVVGGRGFEAVKALASVKDRVDNNTNICLLNDGMGVLEQVRQKIFTDTKTEPNFVLGHSSHALAFNRNRFSTKELQPGRVVLTRANAILEARKSLHPSKSQTDFLWQLQQMKELSVKKGPYHQWLKFKLPSMMFTAAVEPVCVLLDLPYSSLTHNKSAQSMMNQLLEELTTVVDNMPEIEGSAELRAFVRGEELKKFCYRRIKGKSDAPSDLQKRVDKGLQTDMNYQNGYFVKRAKDLGIDLPANNLMMQMVKARRVEAIEKRRSFIPVVETSDIANSRYQPN